MEQSRIVNRVFELKCKSRMFALLTLARTFRVPSSVFRVASSHSRVSVIFLSPKRTETNSAPTRRHARTILDFSPFHPFQAVSTTLVTLQPTHLPPPSATGSSSYRTRYADESCFAACFESLHIPILASSLVSSCAPRWNIRPHQKLDAYTTTRLGSHPSSPLSTTRNAHFLIPDREPLPPSCRYAILAAALNVALRGFSRGPRRPRFAISSGP